MRDTLVVGVIFFLASFGIAGAALQERPPATICSPGTVVKWSNAMGPSTSKEQGQAEYINLIKNNNFCTNEVVTTGGAIGNYLQDQITCICPDAKALARVGCNTGQIQPTVTTTIKPEYTGCVRATIVISKCVADPDAAYEAACQRGQNTIHVDASAAYPGAPGISLGQTPSAPSTPNAATEALAQALEGRFDAADPAARRQAQDALVRSGVPAPDAAAAIAKITQGDAEGGKAIVEKDTGISPATLDSITRLAPPAPGASAGVGGNPGAGNGMIGGATGFGGAAAEGAGNITYYAVASPFSEISGTGYPGLGYGGLASNYGFSSFGFGSPFANVTPAPSGYLGQQSAAANPAAPQSAAPASNQQPQQAAQPFAAQQLGALNPPAQSPVSQTLAATTTASAAAATLVAQPSAVAPGDPIVVSWSSVGTSETHPCAVSQNGSVIAQKNEGSAIVQAAPGGTAFALECTSESGQSIARSAEVIVKQW